MKASELIKELQLLIEEHGDQDVLIDSELSNYNSADIILLYERKDGKKFFEIG
jgi:hypothetical protein